MMDKEFVNQTDLGKLFDLTSHQIGRILMRLGLRNPDRTPTQLARERGYCKQRTMDNGYGDWLWHRVLTARAIENAGYPRKGDHLPSDDPAKTAPLSGPFICRQMGGLHYAIESGDGSVVVWCDGPRNADTLTRLMNKAHEQGLFQKNAPR